MWCMRLLFIFLFVVCFPVDFPHPESINTLLLDCAIKHIPQINCNIYICDISVHSLKAANVNRDWSGMQYMKTISSSGYLSIYPNLAGPYYKGKPLSRIKKWLKRLLKVMHSYREFFYTLYIYPKGAEIQLYHWKFIFL